MSPRTEDWICRIVGLISFLVCYQIGQVFIGPLIWKP